LNELATQDGRVLLAGLITRVTGRARTDVEHIVRADRERAVEVLTGVRQVVDQRFDRTDATIRAERRAEHLFGSHEVEQAVMNRQAVEARPVDDHHRRAVGSSIGIQIHHPDDVGLRTAADIDAAIGRYRDHARIAEVLGPDADIVTLRHLEALCKVSTWLKWRQFVKVRVNSALVIVLGLLWASADPAKNGRKRALASSCDFMWSIPLFANRMREAPRGLVLTRPWRLPGFKGPLGCLRR
jgi:hypothetical protein